ncbi:Fc.00g003780.m01.CDS01 [Cosmosporella sp. VM-42]
MPSQKSSTEDEASPVPATPRKASASKKGNNAKTTPGKPGLTPRSAPAGAGARPRSHSRRGEPTLLTDFILGRPSPARIALDKQRRMSLEAVKAELRHEMKQNRVEKLQPPGGVRDRVKNWQKTNTAAMVAGDPDDAATEPTEIAFKDDVQSVTESDRVRIKLRQRKRPKKPTNKSQDTLGSQEEKTPDAEPTPTKPPPKKRVVSDDHWMKRKNRRSPPRKVSPKMKKLSPQPIPKDFTLRAANPSVSNKVKAWASKVEIPEPPAPKSHRSSRSMDTKSRQYDTESEFYSDMGETASQVTSSYVTNSQVTARRTAKSASAADDGIRVRPIRKKGLDDDGIRVRPTKSYADDDGIRVRPTKSYVDDDGIRVRPMSEVSSEAGTRPGSARTTRLRSRTAPSSRAPSSRRERSPSERIQVVEDESEVSKIEVTEDKTELSKTEMIDEQSEVPEIMVVEEESELSKTTARRDEEDDHAIHAIEEEESLLDTPTKRPSTSKSKRKPRPKSYHPGAPKAKDEETWTVDEESHVAPSYLAESDLSSSILAKSIADIPGEIPWGNSAFSELDLPRGGGVPRSRPKRPKVERNSSLKAVPKVFKKVMEEGKKIIHEMNEPPKQPVANKPPSIENWLNNTVDPFVDERKDEAAPTPAPVPAPAPQLEPVDTERPLDQNTHRRSSQAAKKARRSSTKVDQIEEDKKSAPPAEESNREPTPDSPREPTPEAPREPTPEPKKKSTPSRDKVKSPSSGGLKRSRATRSTSSPVKSAGKRPFLGFLKEAFQGESKSHIPTPKTYQGVEERKYEQYEDEDDWEGPESSYRESSYRQSSSRSVSPEVDRPVPDLDDRMEPTTPTRMIGPRLKPPTNGHHELSTILSEEGSSAVDSDLTSDVSHSTLTQSTVLTRDSELSRSKNHGSGLKRRLTKHSDLVSVLSLPNDSNIPNGIKSNRSRPSLRKNRGGHDDVTTDDLLREFAEDENLYLRELKTLVDGVIPVLLSQAVNGDNDTELFGQSRPTNKADPIPKSVLSMGVSLEKLKNAHRIAPVSDMRRLAGWAHGVVPIYHKYLDAWRLGFQDLVVNLAPAAGRLDDEDSLLNAMPRNEDGDIVNAEGERVDVAHLLKRPLLRVKQMAKFIKCVDSILRTSDTYDLLHDFEDLQEKARRRHREETARMMDEDAIHTDTTRSRDLRTLAPMEFVVVDPTRQVSAKDFFSLDLAHSNGQRLECQVELVHRDNEHQPQDRGDLLIRETGDGRRSYLLLPPIPMELISARTGDGNFDMVVMIRGTHNDRPWHELLTLYADNEDQILDWLDILPVAPVPPLEPEPSVIGDDDEPPPRVDVPVGVRGLRKFSPRSPAAEDPSPPASPVTPTKRPLPARYRPNRNQIPTTPPRASPDARDLERTPTQDDYRGSYTEDRSRPLSENMRPDPTSLRSSSGSTYRDDGAPPPPAHRTLSPSPSPSPQATPKSTAVTPPAELQSKSRLKRRTSSPLKHEYLPSDGSSVSGISSLTEGTERTITESDYESGSESSDDEIESVDLPETELGFSIREDTYEDEILPPPRPMDSVLSTSECSLTPSNSASQAGLHGPKAPQDENTSRFIASISRWSEKGLWKDVCVPTCSIIVTPGMIEAYALQSGGEFAGNNGSPMLALDLTPLVLIRQSTAVDLEIRSSVRPGCQLAEAHGGGNFRFRCHTGPDCFNFYMAVHHARLNNQKFIELENEARFKSFGERKAPPGDDDTSSRRRSWFGRKNSYRGSTRAPSQSHDGASTTPSSSLSASSFLKRLTGGGNLSFNLARSSVDRQSRAGSLYNGSSSNGFSTPRSPSISVENSGRSLGSTFGTENIKIRLHLLVSAAKWEDYGNCSLQIRKPPPGWHQALQADHGLEKRVTVTTIPRKDSDKPVIVLDAVLGSGCFTPMGSRGIVCGVWEEVKDGAGVVGMVPATGATGGTIKKWCFQCASVAEASWVLRLVHQEVLRA